MNAIMVDNWLMQEVMQDFYDYEKQEISDAYARFLSSIVLWDEIYYPENEMTFCWKQLPESLRMILNPIEDTEHLFDAEASRIYHDKYSETHSSIVAQGAIRYYKLSNHHDLDYLPTKERTDFFANTDFLKYYERLNRLNYMETLDSAIDTEHDAMMKQMGVTHFQMKQPVLVDYIIQNAPKDMTYFEYALHLKNEGPVETYRKYLSDVEAAIEKGEGTVLREMSGYSEKLVKDICDMDKKSIGTLGIALYPTQSFSFSTPLKVQKRRIHLTFLRDLVEFSYRGRML